MVKFRVENIFYLIALRQLKSSMSGLMLYFGEVGGILL
jgi:hypothetical protein